jgi:hypothetical protein
LHHRDTRLTRSSAARARRTPAASRQLNFNDVVTLGENLAHTCGYAVFPCRHDKRPACPHGFKDATSDPVEVRPLWRRYPGPLIGVATGVASGVAILDIDIKSSEARAWWFENEHRVPETRCYRTRSGGLHAVFQHAPGVRNAQGEPVPGIDVRGEGGYVVWWFATGHECLDHSPPAPWPTWLSALFWPPLKPVLHRYPHRAITLSDRDLERIRTTAIDRVRSAADGQRHYRLRASARLLGGIQHRAGFSDTDAVGWLLAAVPGPDTNPSAEARTVLWGLESGRSAPLEARP